jgi:glycosyltransferase involved in cell wall biosynthesis
MAGRAASDCPPLPRRPEVPVAVGRRRVLMVAFHYPPANTPGALRTLKFTKYLGDHGWDARVLTVPVKRCATPDAALLRQIPPDIRVHRIPCFDSKSVFAIRGKYPAFVEIPDRYVSWLPVALSRALRIIRADDIDAVFSTSPIPTAHLIALGIKVVTGLPWVADFRDPWSAQPGRGRLQRRIDERLERAVVGHADRVVAVTPSLAEQLCGLHGEVTRRKIHVIYNGYDEDDFVALAASGASEAVFRLAHAGYLYPEFRQPTTLLHAVRRCLDAGTVPPDMQLCFLGGGEAAASPVLARQVADLRLGDAVGFSERIAHHAALAAMTSSSALLLLQDGANSQLPSKCFEYLRTGRPLLVLAPAGSATDEALRGFARVYRADADDVAGIAVALGHLYEEWKCGTRVIDRRGPNLERFQRRRATQALAEVLDALVSEQSLRSR